MFVKYEVISTFNSFQEPKAKYIDCKLIDSVFEEEFIAEQTTSGLDVITPIITIYEDRKLPVAPNLAKLCKHLIDRFHLSKDYILSLEKINKDFARYRKDIDKYMVLL